MSQLGEKGYDKMKMGHVLPPHCTLAHILVFFCITTGIWYLPVGRWVPSFFTREAGSWIATNSELTFDSLEKNRRYLNICERIGVRVPVDLSILVTWRNVAVVIAGEARACQNFEIGGLPFLLALSCFRNFHAVAVFIVV